MLLNWLIVRRIGKALWRRPGFSGPVAVSLALAVAANGSVFSVLDAVVFRPLPFTRSSELLHIGLGTGEVANLPVPEPYYATWLQSNRSLASMAAYYPLRVTMTNGGPPEEVEGAAITPGFAAVFQVTPELGRFLAPEDEGSGADQVVVLSHALWARRFGADSLVIGRAVEIGDQRLTVVGVMPPMFAFPRHAQFWRSMPPAKTGITRYFSVVARHRPAFAARDAQRDLAGVPLPAITNLPPPIASAGVVVISLHDQLFGPAYPAMAVLFASAALLLIVTCANVANLVLARAIGRRGEFALRRALGAPAHEVVSEVMAECLALAMVGGTVGFVGSYWIARLFVGIGPPLLANAGVVALGTRVALFAVALSVAVAAVVGALGARYTAGVQSMFPPAIQLRTVTAGHGVLSMRRLLVVVQVATAMLLVTGAGLLTKSFFKITHADLGFDPAGVVIVSMDPPRSRYVSAASVHQLFDDLSRDLSALPNVKSVAYGTAPMGGFNAMQASQVAGTSRVYSIATDAVGPDYFETYRIPLLLGRGIRVTDAAGAPPVVVLNSAAAHELFPNRSPLGETISASMVNGQHPTVVGVAANVPQYDVTTPVVPEAYSSAVQVGARPRTIGIRVHGDPAAVVEQVRRTIGRHDAGLAVQVTMLENTAHESMSAQRLASTLVGGYGALAVVVAAIGLYGLLSYLAAERNREIGIRMALGAHPLGVMMLIGYQGALLTGMGIASGALLAVAFGGLLRRILFAVQPHDAAVFLGSGCLLLLVAALATVIPAWRAARVDPVLTLRHD